MSHDSLTAMWISDPPPSREALMTAMNAVLSEDRAAREKDRWMKDRRGTLGRTLVSCAPLVRRLWHHAARPRRLCPDGRRDGDPGIHRVDVLGLGPASPARASGLAVAVAEERIPPGASGQPDENGTTMVRACFHRDGADWYLGLPTAQRRGWLSTVGADRRGMGHRVGRRPLSRQEARRAKSRMERLLSDLTEVGGS